MVCKPTAMAGDVALDGMSPFQKAVKTAPTTFIGFQEASRLSLAQLIPVTLAFTCTYLGLRACEEAAPGGARWRWRNSYPEANSTLRPKKVPSSLWS